MASVLVISVDFYPNVGGISVMTHYLANAICRLGHDVRLLAPENAVVPEDMIAGYELVVDKASDTRLREGMGYYDECRRIGGLLAELHERSAVDAILLLHPFYYGYAILQTAVMLGIRIGCFFHGYELRSQLLKTPGPNERKGRHSRAAEDLRHSTIRLLHDCDCVFVNSSVTGDLVYGQGRSDFNVTGCGIDDILLAECSMSYPEKRRACCAARSRLGLPSEPMTLGFLGRIVPSKNVTFLVRLLSIRKNWRLAVAGSGDVEELQCLSRELGVADRVEWLGALSENEKWDFYTALDALCLPSIMLPEGQMEGFGIVLLEATLRGTPIIVSTRGGMRDFVLDANGLYIDVDDPEESATLIDEFLCDETTVKRAVQNAQTLLATHLTYDRVAERILGDILPS